jgi:hypothetical protein
MRAFVGEHLTELVVELEADGRPAAATLNTAAENLVEAFAVRERIAHEIGRLVAQVGRQRPGDVSRSRADAAVQAVRALLDAGGEVPATLTHDPREPRLGSPAEAVPA